MPEIVFFSDFPFGYHNREPEERMARFASRGYRVLYVEKLGVRDPHLRHLPRVLRSVRAPAPSTADSSLERLSPKLLPPRRAPGVQAINRRWLNDQVMSRVHDESQAILWLRYPTPELVPLIESASPGLVIYELADEHERSPGLSRRLRRALREAESRILARANVVFASARPVHERLSALHPNVVLAPAAAVDVEAFSSPASATGPADRVAVYAGSLDFRFDAELVRQVARLLPEWRFRVAGPVLERSASSPLPESGNVELVGELPPAEVPRLLGGATVLLMPYRRDAFADTLFPVKLIEYLAAGRPVVSAPIQAVEEFSDVVSVASDPSSFAAAIERAAEDDSPEAARRRVERARRYSWDALVETMESAIREARSRG